MLIYWNHGLVMDNVSREVYDDNITIAFSKLRCEFKAVIGRLIVHQNDFVILVDKFLRATLGR